MKRWMLVVAVLASVGYVVHAAPAAERMTEERLLDLLTRLADDPQVVDGADDEGAVLEEQRVENGRIDQLVEKEDGAADEALLQFQKKHKEEVVETKKKEEGGGEERHQQRTDFENFKRKDDFEERELELLGNIERDLLLMDLKKALEVKRISAGVGPPNGGK